MRVDSIIRFTLKYNIDSSQNAQSIKVMPSNSTPILIIRDKTSIPLAPLLIMDDQLIEIRQLDNVKIGVIKSIQIIKPDDSHAKAIYGSRGALGIILLYTQHYKRHSAVLSPTTDNQ